MVPVHLLLTLPPNVESIDRLVAATIANPNLLKISRTLLKEVLAEHTLLITEKSDVANSTNWATAIDHINVVLSQEPFVIVEAVQE